MILDPCVRQKQKLAYLRMENELNSDNTHCRVLLLDHPQVGDLAVWRQGLHFREVEDISSSKAG